MILHPLIIALLSSSLLLSFMILYSSWFGARILRHWDLSSGSELQLRLERRTYLVSTLLAYLFATQLISLFLFIYTVDRLHGFFVGAMCAAGTLNADPFGYPALLFKVASFFAAGLWLILNHVDNRGYDYPLIKTKYRFLLFIAPLVLAETVLEALFFLGLKPAIITSCCGSLFSAGGGTLMSDLAAAPPGPMKVVYALSVLAVVVTGFIFYRKGLFGTLFAILSGVSFVVSILALLSFVSLYVYELPTHHCPFCVLQSEYGYLGYPLYVALFGAGICGVGVGLLMPFRKVKILTGIVPSVQRKLALVSLILTLAFAAAVSWKVIASRLTLGAGL
jgi:hypothetical protein